MALSIAYRILGSASEAEDVVQEGFLRRHLLTGSDLPFSAEHNTLRASRVPRNSDSGKGDENQFVALAARRRNAWQGNPCTPTLQPTGNRAPISFPNPGRSLGRLRSAL